MLPALAGFAAKALLPSEKKINKDKFFDKKESSAIKKVDDESDGTKGAIIKKKVVSTNLFLPPSEIKSLPPTGEVKKDVKSGKLDNIFDRVGETLQGIIDNLKNRNQTQKEEESNKKQEAKLDEKKKREEKLEKDSKKKPFKMPNIKAPEDKFNLMRFFGNVLLGSLALAIFNNLEQIIDTLKNVFQTIKDFITKVGEFFSPIWDGLKWITGEGTKLIGQLLGVPPENLDSKDIEKNINEISKKIPFLENLFKGIKSIIDSLRGGGEPDQPGPGGDGGDAGGGYVSPAVGSKSGAYDIASKIGANKHQWDTYRNTIAQIESGGRYDVAGGSGKYYDGRYQMGAEAKTDAARILGIPDPGHSSNPNDPRRVAFRKNPELQERMFAAYTLANHGYLSSDSNYQSKQTIEQKLQVLGYAHNQGAGGASKWMRTGKVGKDGFGTSGTKYSNALREAFKRSPSYRQQQADITATQASQQFSTQTQPTPQKNIQQSLIQLTQNINSQQSQTNIKQSLTQSTQNINSQQSQTNIQQSSTQNITSQQSQTNIQQSSTQNITSQQSQTNIQQSQTNIKQSLTQSTQNIKDQQSLTQLLTTQAQISPTQLPPPVSASVPQIMQQTEYEIPGGTSSSTILPIPIGGGSASMVMGGGGTRLIPIGMSKQSLLNSYYQTQLIGFLYKQG